MVSYSIPPNANTMVLGDGPAVICVHGIAASLYDWQRLLPALADNGYRGYALDLLGHGESPKPTNVQAYHIDVLYEHFTRWLQSLALQKPPVLVGHSLGGYLSLKHAIQQPAQVRAIVLIDPFFTIRQISPILRLLRRRPALGARALHWTPEWLINALMGWDPISATEYTPTERQRIANDYKRAAPQIVYITRHIPDLAPHLPKLDTPTLVIWGEQDHTLAPESFPRLVSTLPRAHGAPIPRIGHQPHIGQPDLVNQLVLEFLNQLQKEPIPE